ncbi:MAG: hypothetical protein WAX44_02620 [Minisyncoccia bacterium]
MSRDKIDKIISVHNRSKFDGVLLPTIKNTTENTKKSANTNFGGSLFISGFRLASVIIVSFGILISVSSVGGTVSYFNDRELSLSNYLRADPIIFSVSPASSQVDLSGESSLELIMTPDPTSDPIQYFVSSKKVSGDDLFCNSIHILGTWPFPVDGQFVGLVTETSNTTGSWTLNLSVPEEAKVPNSSCEIELTYFGWNDGVSVSKAFTDTKKVLITLFIPDDYVAKNQAESLVQSIISSQESNSFSEEDNSSNKTVEEESLRDREDESKSENEAEKVEKIQEKVAENENESQKETKPDDSIDVDNNDNTQNNQDIGEQNNIVEEPKEESKSDENKKEENDGESVREESREEVRGGSAETNTETQVTAPPEPPLETQ